jgi:hypothetical protein
MAGRKYINATLEATTSFAALSTYKSLFRTAVVVSFVTNLKPTTTG